ncbi:MAG: YqaE/Pmp3 family membrane protein [Flavobacteriales bacterium]
MKSIKILGIASLVALAMSSCSGLRYTNYGKPLDFLHAKSYKAAPVKTIETEKELTEKQELSKVERKQFAKTKTEFIEVTPVKVLEPSLEKSSNNNAKNKAFLVNEEASEMMELTKAEQHNPVLIGKSTKSQDRKQPNVDQLLLILLCIFIPPLAVYLVHGIGTEFWIDLILCLLFFLPGIIYALIVCL